jgi:colanic acid/amylovoran biosynthesis glycosyltransferase
MAYLFERFPAFTKTFCAREVAELYRQNRRIPVFSIRRPNDERPLNIPLNEVAIHYFPDSNSPIFKIPTRWAARRFKDYWDREVDSRDKHRFYEAIYLGHRLSKLGIEHLHIHFAGIAARTAWWVKKLFGISYSFTGHANDIFVEKPNQRVALKDLVADARFVVTVSDYGVDYLRSRFPFAAKKIYRVYNGLDLAQFLSGASLPRKDTRNSWRLAVFCINRGFVFDARSWGAGRSTSRFGSSLKHGAWAN